MSFVLEVGLYFPLVLSLASGFLFSPQFPVPWLSNSARNLRELNGLCRWWGQNSAIQGLAERKEERRAPFFQW